MHEIGVLRLHGAVQHYDWGGCDFISGLLSIANNERRPFAELWCLEHVDNLGAYSIPPETGLLIPSVFDSYTSIVCARAFVIQNGKPSKTFQKKPASCGV